MAFNLKKYNPFGNDFDWGRSLLAIGTLGTSLAVEAGGELLGEGLKKGVVETGRGLGNVARDAEAGWNLGFNGGLTGGSKKENTPASMAASRELYDPRRKRSGNINFSSLTTGQFDNAPSLIG